MLSDVSPISKHPRVLMLLLFAGVAAWGAAGLGPAKDFTVPAATDGSIIHLSEYAGKVVLINWWRTDCPWSQRESPKLVGLYQKYRPKGLVILGISDDHGSTVGQVPAYLKRYNITWFVGLNDQGEFMREMIVQPKERGSTPGNFIVTRSGEVTYLGLDRGDADWQKLENAVAAAVAESPGKTTPIQPRNLFSAPAFSLPDLQGNPVLLASRPARPGELLRNLVPALSGRAARASGAC